MPTLAGKPLPLQKRSSDPALDPAVARALRALEEKIEEMDRRITDLERRAAAGGI